jgi:4-hydroxy-3-polyprenylbenzoate decarboxylase
MITHSTRDVVDDLRQGGRLVECDWEVDPNQEAAEIHRRVVASGGPAIYFPKVRGCQFSLVSNLFANFDQAHYLFRHTWERVRKLIELKGDPLRAVRQPLRYATAPITALRMLPKSVRRGPVQQVTSTLARLPQIVSWPRDGGPFITLPQVLSRVKEDTGLSKVNLGMYRVQLSGNEYQTDSECGLHYQIHRGIGVHHRRALDRQSALPVTITVGGSPAMTLAAVMPLPEGLSELTFAGALSGKRVPLIDGSHAPVYADADFAIVGRVMPGILKPEGPFGDHLGYYSLTHPFPVLSVEHVWHRKNAVWPFTVVGRPPQEDSAFGALIHALTGDIIPQVLPGVRGVHAVDEAGVHPLLLALGSERYMPFLPIAAPQELLTQAHAILGQGQLSLAKYLLILNHHDVPDCNLQDIPRFFAEVLRRVDWRRDLHFSTRTTIDTLDYSGDGLNQGSKVVIAAAGPPIRELARELPSNMILPSGYDQPRLIAPGILAVRGPALSQSLQEGRTQQIEAESIWRDHLPNDSIVGLPLVIISDDSDFVSHSFKNFLWVTFTRSQPATDIYGIGATVANKHWGCRGSLVIDARVKGHHAPVVAPDPEIAKRVDAMATRGGTLAKYL